jgi:hypothetical protein
VQFSAPTLAAVFTALLIITPTAAAQPPDGVIRGEVTDTSGGVLPGVTVVATSGDERIFASTVTDAVGRYILRAVRPGPLTLKFHLDGFDVETIQVVIVASSESQVVTRLKLAQITERVVVYGTAPVDPPPPPPPPPPVPWSPPVPHRRPDPIVIPVPAAEIELVCGPAKPGLAPTAIALIQSLRHHAGRTIYTKGDELNIDGGTLIGLSVGRNLVARRYFRTNDSGRAGNRGEHTAGLVQIVSASELSSIGVVVHACSELMEGDFLASFSPDPARAPGPEGMPLFDDAIRILFAGAGQMFGVPGRLLVIDRGGAKGISVGQRLTLFRRDGRRARPFVLGEAVVVSTRTHSATIRIEHASDVISFDDLVAPQLASPLAAPPASASRLPPR